MQYFCLVSADTLNLAKVMQILSNSYTPCFILPSKSVYNIKKDIHLRLLKRLSCSRENGSCSSRCSRKQFYSAGRLKSSYKEFKYWCCNYLFFLIELSNTSQFVCQLLEDKPLALRAHDLVYFITDQQTVIISIHGSIFILVKIFFYK